MIKNYVIVVLLALVAFFLITNNGKPVENIVIKRDTLYQQKTLTQYKKGESIPYRVIVKDSIKVHIHDTIRIISDYMRIYAYSDTIKLDTGNIVFIQDTISQNKILGRGVTAKLSEKTIIETKTITAKPKNALYLGFLGDFRQDIGIDGAGLGIMYKVKDKALIGLNLKTGQGVKYGFGVYLKL